MGCPGWHLYHGESPEECVERETKEETGIKITNIRKGTFTNDFFKESGKHYVTLWMVVDYKSGEVAVMEPDKCERWEWFTWGEKTLPQPLFLPVTKLLADKWSPFDV